MFTFGLLILTCLLFQVSLAGNSKVCPHPQKFGHERGICNERLMFVVHYQVCPLYRDGLTRYAKNPQNPSPAAIAAANNFVIAKLQKKPADNKRTRRANSDADLSSFFDDATATSPPIAAIDLLANRPVSRRLVDALNFVRTGGAPATAWNSMLNTKNWTPQNIVCECCYNVCTIQEMTEYCPKAGK